MHSRGFFIDFHFRLHGVKIFFVNKSRDSIGNYHIAEFVFAYVLAVSKDTEHGVVVHRVSAIFNTARSEKFCYVVYPCTAEIKGVNLFHDRGSCLVYLIQVAKFALAGSNYYRRNKIISYQVVRIEQFNKGSLGKIGGETERTSKHHRNEDIDDERTPLNLYFKKSKGGLTAQWKKTMKELNATFREKKKSVAFEGMIITSDTAFFERLGWKKDEETPYAVMEFFNRCYEFALQEIGYHGTDKNILSAVIHVDEKTPHLQLYYIPVVDTAKKKVYEKGVDGKVLRN